MPSSPASSAPPLGGVDPDAAVLRPTRSAFASMTLRGAVAMAIAYGATRLGYDPGAGVAQDVAGRALDLIFTLGAMAVSLGRARAKGPLT